MGIKRNETEIKNFLKEIENATEPKLVLAREIIEQKLEEDLKPDNKDRLEDILNEAHGYAQEALDNINLARIVLGK